jgi:hypothetical protein
MKAILIALCLLLGVCLPGHAGVIERSSITRFHVTDVHAGENTYLHVRGQVLAEFSKGCTELRTTRHGDELRLTTSLKYFKKGVPFDFMVTVPPGIKRVVFGKLRKQVWPTDAEATPYSEDEQKALISAVKEFKTGKPDLDPDDYYVFVDKLPGNLSENKDHYSVTFFQDGPAPCAVRALYHYRVSKSDGSVTFNGRSFSGQMQLLERLGKIEGLN